MSQPRKRESLLTQLENIHKQVNDETQRASIDRSESDGIGSESSDVSHKKKPSLFSNVLSKREKINSMPMFAGSSSHNSVLADNSSQNMNFVMGLSENLLVECRKLQAENDKKAFKLKTIQQDYENLEDKYGKLDSHNRTTAKELEVIKDSNWELEAKLQNFSIEFKELKDRFNKNKRELKNELNISKNLKAELEVATIENSGLQKKFDSINQHHMIEIVDLKQHVSDLNDENDSLHMKYKNFYDEVQKSKSINDVTFNETADKPNIAAAEYEALKDDLSHAHHIIAGLKCKIKRLNTTKNNDVRKKALLRDSNTANNKEGLGKLSSNDHSDSEASYVSDVIDETPSLNDLNDANEGRDFDFDDSLSFFEIEKYAKARNMVILSNEAYESLNNSTGRGTESEEAIAHTIKNSNLVALPNDDTCEKNYSQKLTNEEMIQSIEACGYKVLSYPDYNEIQKKLSEIENPSETYLASKAKDQDKVILSKEIYENALHPPIDEMITRLNQTGHFVLHSDEHQSLLNAINNPTFEYLAEKLLAMNKLSISKDDYEKFTSPDIDDIIKQANTMGYTAIPNREYNEMRTNLSNPSIDLIKETLQRQDSQPVLTWLADKHHCNTLTEIEFDKLHSSFTNPTEEFLREKANKLGFELVNKVEYKEMEQILDQPSLEFLKKKAVAFNNELVPEEQLKGLVSTSEKPSLDFLKLHAKRIGFLIIPEDEYQSLKRTVDDPGLEYLRSKAKNHKLVADDLYETLSQTSIDPSLKFLTEKAKAKGYDVVSADGQEELLRKALKPSKEEVETLANNLGSVLVPVRAYEELKTVSEAPTKEFIEDKADKMNLYVIDKKEYTSLAERGASKEFMFTSAKTLGFIPIPIAQLTALKGSSISNASLSDIQNRLTSLGYVAISSENYEILNQPVLHKATRDDTIALCSKYSLKPVLLEEYEKLKQDSKKVVYSEDEQILMLQSHGYVVLTKTEHESIKNRLEAPDLEFLQEHAAKSGNTVIKEDEHRRNIQLLECPPAEFLKERASNIGLVVVEEKLLKSFEKQIESPSKEFLEEKAAFLGMTLIPVEEWKYVTKQIEHPELPYLRSKAIEIKKCLIDQDEYAELQRRTTFPNHQELEADAMELNMTVVAKDEYVKLSKQVEDPSLEYLHRNIKRLSFVPVPRAEYDLWQKKHDEPEEAYLSDKATRFGKILVDKTGYMNQQKAFESPSEKYLAEKSIGYHKVLVNESEHKSNLANLTTPSEDYLIDKARSQGLAVIPQLELDQLKNTIENPSLDSIKDKLKFSEYALVEEKRYEELKKQAASPSLAKITVAAKTYGYVLVYAKDLATHSTYEGEDLASLLKCGTFVLLNKETYDALLHSTVNKINKREVIDLCSKFELVPISSAEYEELRQVPDMGKLESYADQHASVVIAREEYDLMRSEIDCPSEKAVTKSAKQNGLSILKKTEYENLLQKVNNATKHDVEKQAEKLGLVTIPSKKYDALLKEIHSKPLSSTPSPSSKVLASKQYFEQVIRNENEKSEKFLESTKTLGFVTLSNEEYKNLKENQKEHVLTRTDIYHGAKSFDLTVLPTEKYKELLKKKFSGANLDYSDLEHYAARFDMKLIPLNLKDVESPTPQRTKPVGSGHGVSLTFHDQNSSLSLSSCATNETEYFDAEDSANNVLQRQATTSTVSSTDYTDALDNNMEDDVSDVVSHASTVRAQEIDETASLDSLKAKAKNLGYVLIPTDTKRSIDDEIPELVNDEDHDANEEPIADTTSVTSSLNEQTLKEKAAKLDMVVLPKLEYEKYTAIKEPVLTRETVKDEASELGLIVLERDEYDDIRAKAVLDKDCIKKSAAQFGLRVLAEEDYKKMEDQLKEGQLTVENINSRANALGYVAIRKEEFEKLEHKVAVETPRLTKEEFERKAPEFGFSLPLRADDLDLAGNESQEPEEKIKENVIRRAHSLGMVILTEEEYKQLIIDAHTDGKQEQEQEAKQKQEGMTVDDVVERAAAFGLVPIEKEQFEQIKEELANPTFTKEQIVEQAQKHDLIAIGKEEYQRLKKPSTNNVLIKTDSTPHAPENREDDRGDGLKSAAGLNEESDDLDQLMVTAKKHKLLCVPQSTFIVTQFGETPDPENVVVLPTSYYHELLAKEGKLSEETEEEESNASEKASNPTPSQKKNYHFNPPPRIGSQKMNRQNSRGSLRSVASGTRKNLVNAAAANANNDFEKHKETCFQPSSKAAHHSRASSLVTRNASLMDSSVLRSGSVGGISLATVASLSEPSIIPALTQTVIGEYLYKYYPYLGPLGIQSRHERYFWVHPYTLTLYWSASNPVLDNPSNHRTRCAAILGVDSIVDANPYPAGLYHKSIIITSEHKTIKITCPTRQRHNIWYNSLRYLLQRNMEGISLEDIADDPSDTMYSGKIFPLPGENSKSANQRLSGSRRSVRTKLPKSASLSFRKR